MARILECLQTHHAKMLVWTRHRSQVLDYQLGCDIGASLQNKVKVKCHIIIH